MRRFNIIKKSRKKSEDIDEKIEYLDKECQKNGLCEIANSTTGLYTVLGNETNSKHNDFQDLSNDGASLGFSGSEYNINAEPLDGFKYSPPHPVSGQRKKAFSWFGIASGFQPVNATSDREILWIFDQTLNSGFGDYFSLELSGGSSPFWGSWIDTAFGTSMLVPYNSDFSPLSDAIQNALNNLNINQFLNPEEFGPPTNPILFKNDLGDPTHLPIDLNNLSPQGFNYLKGKATETNVASGVNYDLYNYLDKTYGIEASNWYENNPTLPHESNPFIPPAAAPYVPLASNPNNQLPDGTEIAAIPDALKKFFNLDSEAEERARERSRNFIKNKKKNLNKKMFPGGIGSGGADINFESIDVRRFNIIKKSRKKSEDIDEKIEYLNKEFRKTNIQEVMTTTNIYFAGKTEPAVPAVNEPVPDSTGVTGDDFAQPLSGDPDDPSNWPDAYTNNDWMFNSDDVGGETGRPIVSTIDSSVIDAYNNAFPDDSRFPAGGAGIVFGDIGFGTGVGYAKGGHYIGVLSPGLFGNGSTKIVPPGSPFGAPYFGMFGMYFPATPELADVIMAMSGAYMKAGGYNPQGALRIKLWKNHSRFHHGPYDDYSGKKYTDSEGRRYILGTFFLHNKTSNTYEVSPEIPPQTIVLQKDDLGNSDFLPIDIDGVSPEAFEYLRGRSNPNTGRGKGDTGDKGDKTTKTDGEMDKREEDEKRKEEEEKRRLEELKNLARSYDNKILSDIKYAELVISGIAIYSMAQYVAALIAAGYASYEIQRLLNEAVATVNSTVDTFDQQDIFDIGNIQTSVLQISGDLVSDEKVGGMSDSEWDQLRGDQAEKENDAIVRVKDKLEKARNGGRKKVIKSAEKALEKLKDIKAKNKARRQQITKLRKQAQKLADEAKAAYREMERLGIKDLKDAPPHIKEKITNLRNAMGKNVRGEVNRQYLKRHFPKGPGGEFGSYFD